MPDDKEQSPLRKISFKQFFEVLAPGNIVEVHDLVKKKSYPGGGSTTALNLPTLELHCDICKGVRFFSSDDEPSYSKAESFFVTFRCRNCEKRTKTYAISAAGLSWSEDKTIAAGTAHKFGEIPAFGPPTSARLISLLGSEKDYFLKGRRAENQGLGIAAFAYYRRVVENRKDKSFDEIIRVSTKIGASPESVADLQAAKSETQFSKAVETVKHGIPQTLLLNGDNPLTLLHSALSEGLHA